MDPDIVLLFLLFVVLAAGAGYWGWVSRESSPFRWSTQASFIFLVLVPIPFCFLVLLDETQATARLARQGVVPHPSIRNAVGVAAGGGRGPVGLLLGRAGLRDPTWVFRVRASPAEICAFYRDGANAPGWTLAEDGSPVMIILERGPQTLVVGPHQNLDGSREVIYMITNKAGSRPIAK